MGRDEERFGTAKNQTISHVSGILRMRRDDRNRITKPLLPPWVLLQDALIAALFWERECSA
jgi:hypothetical protein